MLEFLFFRKTSRIFEIGITLENPRTYFWQLSWVAHHLGDLALSLRNHLETWLSGAVPLDPSGIFRQRWKVASTFLEAQVAGKTVVCGKAQGLWNDTSLRLELGGTVVSWPYHLCGWRWYFPLWSPVSHFVKWEWGPLFHVTIVSMKWENQKNTLNMLSGIAKSIQ